MKLIIGCLTFCFGFLYLNDNKEASQISKLPYDELWSQVDSLKTKGLPKSALKVVQSIYIKAKDENNTGNQVKSVFFLAELIHQTEEESDSKFYSWLQTELQSEEGVFKAILHTLTAETLYKIYAANSYRLSGRTAEGTIENSGDIKTWSKEDYQRKITSHYVESLNNKSLVKNDISVLDSVINEYSQKSKIYTPTVYDFLVQRALSYFSQNPLSVTRADDYFSITNEDYFLAGKDFIHLNISSQDTISYEFRIIKLYQEYLANISERNLNELFASTDLDRVEYVYSKYDGIDKDFYCDKVLTQLADRYTDVVSVQRILALKAVILLKQGDRYSALSGDTEAFRWKKKEARELLERYLSDNPKVEIIHDFRQLFDQLSAHFLEVKTENVIIPEKPVLLYLKFQNVDSIQIYLKSIPPSNYFEINSGRVFFEKEKVETFINNSDKVLTLMLPNSGDLQLHSTEYFLSGLPSGKYEMLVTGKNNFSPLERDIIAFSSFRVSNLAILENFLSSVKGEKNYVVMDRTSGAAIAEAGVEIYVENYNEKGRSFQLIQTIKTNSQGEFKIPTIQNKNIEVIVRKNGNIIHESLGYTYPRYYENENKKVRYGHLFTDRAIYRPGQTVFFKGILYNRSSDSEKYPTLLKNSKVEVILRDVNGKEVSRKQFTSDNFGGFHGHFNLPSGGLTGNFGLFLSEGIQGWHSVKVEEYKRPKFKVSFDEITESIKLGEDINLTAKAMYFSGIAAEGAEFMYRVVRKSFVPFWYRYYPSWLEQDESVIGGGKGIVTRDGNIDIKFNARPKFSLSNVPKQFYNFEIIVDVIDINGETRTNTLQLSVSSVKRFISATVDEVVFLKDVNERKIEISSRNIQQNPVPAMLSVQVQKLILPSDKFLERYWESPDVHLLAKPEFRKLFPMFSYNGEDMKEQLPVEQTVLTKEFSVEGTYQMVVKELGIKVPGMYKIVINDLESNNKEEVTVFLEILDDKKPDSFSKNVNFFAKTISGEPGQTLGFSITSPFTIEGRLGVFRTADRYDFCPLRLESLHRFTVNITEEDRGGVDVYFFGIKHNRTYQINRRIDVPWDNKKLTVTLDHFRDITMPGVEEDYIISVRNNEGEDVDGRVLASMYDASLDQFTAHQWSLGFSPALKFRSGYIPLSFGALNLYGRNVYQSSFLKNVTMLLDRNIGFKYSIAYGRWYMSTVRRSNADPSIPRTSPPPSPMEAAGSDAFDMLGGNEAKRTTEEVSTDISPENENINEVITIRENFNELVFFYPDIMLKDGKSKLTYKNNEALSEWKLQILAVDNELGTGYLQKSVKTQKDLMVFPNWPRFLRQRDTLLFETRVNNLSKEEISAEVTLISNDAVSGNGLLNLMNPDERTKKVTIEGGGFILVNWEIFVPDSQINPIEYIVKVSGKEQSDAERNVLPVLTNKVLITESLPMPLKSQERKNFIFTKFKEHLIANSSRENVNYVLEYTANPAWLAVQALPYLEEQKFNSTTSVFHRFYANMLAKAIVDKKPGIKKVFEQWMREGSDALLSNLSKNEELKNTLLEETPWVFAADSETEQKLNIARLFEFNKMSFETQQNLNQLKQMQKADGGFAWFEETRSNWYISQSLLSGFIHLHQLGAINIQAQEYQAMIKSLVGYLDKMIVVQYNDIKKQVEQKNTKWEHNHLTSVIIHYLYTRNAYSSLVRDNFNGAEYRFFSDQMTTYWLQQPLFDQALIALATLYKTDKTNKLVLDIVKSMKEKAFIDDEMGVYWARMSGYYWNQSALALQSLIIELLVLSGETSLIDDAVTWLIKNKQTNRWTNSASTVEAIYALLLSGQDVLSSSAVPEIKVGNETLNNQSSIEAGTGYFKKSWTGNDILPALGDVTIKNNQGHIAWGALYWQYFEDIDKVQTSTDGPLKVDRRLYKKVNTSTGMQLAELKDGQLSKGDEVVVRLTIRTDRPMEFIHVKDQRASAFEPVDVLSAYKYSSGLGYYQVTKDISTNFFISMLNRGTYVLEYSARVFQDGNFSTGMTTIESMYAPEFKSHSEGSRYNR